MNTKNPVLTTVFCRLFSKSISTEKDLKKEANLEMQEWQVKETLKRQKQLKDYPALAENFDVVMERLKTKYEL